MKDTVGRKFVFVFLFSLAVVFISCFLIDIDIYDSNYILCKILKDIIMSYIGGFLFTSYLLSIILKLSWDNDGEYVARVVLSSYITFSVIVFIFSLIETKFLFTSISMIVNVILSIVMLWIDTDKREIIT